MSVPASEHASAREPVPEGFPEVKNGFWSYTQPFSAPFSERRLLLVLGDTALVVLSIFAAYLVYRIPLFAREGAITKLGPSWYWFAVLLGGWWVMAWLMDLYHIPSSFDKRAATFRVGVVGLVTLALYGIFYFLIPGIPPRRFFLYLMLMVWPALTLWRWAYASVFGSSSLQHRILIVGQGRRARSIADLLKDSARLNYRVIGYYVDDEPAKEDPDGNGLPVWSQTQNLSELVRRLDVHEVVVAIDDGLNNELFSQLTECQAKGIRVSSMPDLYEQLSRKVPIEYIDPAWVLQVLQGRPVFNRLQLGLKRLLDLAVGVVGLFVLVLALPVIALLIRLDSAGPIFYRQVRSGRAGKQFYIFKLRTMTVDAEKDGKARWASKEDPRITRVGHYLRKSRLDELPQVLNVLQGEMSVVGPRPERPEFIAELQQVVPYYPVRLMVKPGLTGWAQTQYGYGNSVEDTLVKMQYDFYYLRNWSLWLDLYIMVRTLGVVFTLKGT